MPLEGRKPHMVAWREDIPTVHGSGESVATKPRRIAEKARREPSFKFTSLCHLMDDELLRECFRRLGKDGAAGIDKVTREMYASNLDANITELIGRLHRMAYIPQPVRRVYIPISHRIAVAIGQVQLGSGTAKNQSGGVWKVCCS